MCNPPLLNVSDATKTEYLTERTNLYNSLKKRAQLVTRALNKMRNINSQ
jgi:hypothetical protein